MWDVKRVKITDRNFFNPLKRRKCWKPDVAFFLYSNFVRDEKKWKTNFEGKFLEKNFLWKISKVFSRFLSKNYRWNSSGGIPHTRKPQRNFHKRIFFLPRAFFLSAVIHENTSSFIIFLWERRDECFLNENFYSYILCLFGPLEIFSPS